MNPNQPAPQFGSGDASLWGNLITVIVVLGLILVLIVVLLRFIGKRNRIMSQSRSVRTLGAVGLGPNKSLQVIEIGGSIYVVGVGEDISLVDKISGPAEVEALRQALAEEETEFAGLSSILSGVISRFKKEPPQEEELEGTAFHEVFQSQLRKMPNRKRQMEELLQDPEEQSTDRSRDS
ncbi:MULTISPECIES: flagellar biosynthetic protein FliO [Paenibacillus]|uniref:Flagellar biosynthesis, FliO family protein n=1 Tax=Paenibacillus macerans TaxID=44252 RepID=A0A090YAX6_PAEMA|nr:flagellar biosynthetic protein FliO [Paenibacillus macerans]KFM95351.1 flagellar biosynthesis, FliO family protein [Paenibacillus macerans]MBS5913315.1 flagellar biosynthetic protein FliO [Paenibacillus macerans]MCY7562494.1 flagellar biosynthetic protein FliO [Paenibacillus macerans]MDU5950834.1 flagellar biosynthetic protein FliO [Paenibacillus macerans]MEC0149162.1 flagellar biosynthetic protein FliO [Paenibacillus macerans]